MLNIMIVDDSMIIRNTLKKLFIEMGHTIVAEASTGQEAVDIYSKINPDLITLDITMPIKDGIETLKEIKNKHADIKAIMITSHGEQKLVIESIKLGAKGYILKPISKDKIEKVIKKIFPELEN